MGFPKELINEGEELVLDLRPHWWYMAEPTGALVGSILIGIAVIANFEVTALNWAAAALIVFCLGWWVIRYLKWITTNFVLTSDRLVFRQGVIAKSGIEIPLERINTVFFNQSIFERLLGAGDLAVESAGERGREEFSDIRKPVIVQNEIYRQMELNSDRTYGVVRKRNADLAAEAQATPAAAPADPSGDIPAQLERLAQLKAQGVISEQEFAAKKAQLLDRM